MIEGLPLIISILFCVVVIVTLSRQYAATKSKTYLILLVAWTVLQAVLGLTGVFHDASTMPPKILVFGILPPLFGILILFLTKGGRNFIDSFNLKILTYFHIIRIPVEMILLMLYHHGYVSRFMTYEGTNFDLFSGITGPLVAWIAYRSTPVKRNLLIGWNILCLLLLLNVVITAIFALPTPFQLLSPDQPNMAVLYFPFNLLPSVVVPLVFFAHLVALRQLFRQPQGLLSGHVNVAKGQQPTSTV